VVTFFWPSKFGKFTRNTFFWGHMKTSHRNHICKNKIEKSTFIHTSSGVPYTSVNQAAKPRGWVTHGIHFISYSGYIISSTHLPSHCLTGFCLAPHKIQDYPSSFSLLYHCFTGFTSWKWLKEFHVPSPVVTGHTALVFHLPLFL
jgi:hypothetical protein